jgi:chemosensory pili system protein ChpB (putative protein-glutamate methylesterase)
MTDSAPAIALLFDDIELGAQLREALRERGARIVHEGGVSTFSRLVLEQVGADVLVVNLDDSADDALGHLYDLIDGDRPRVVFNDAQASRKLTGWDRARWARHLAVKVLAVGDIDPPRPDNARGLDMVVNAAPEAAPEGVAMVADEAVTTAEGNSLHEVADEPGDAEPNVIADANYPLHDGDDSERDEKDSAESESLAAELEAMLASGELPDEDDKNETKFELVDFGAGLRFANGEEPPPLHDGNFGESSPAWESSFDANDEMSPKMASELDVDSDTSLTPPAFQTDHLELSAMTDPSITTIPASAAGPEIHGETNPVKAPDSWALVDDDAAPALAAESTEMLDAQTFSIEKLSAADFLAPDVEAVDAALVLTMSLKLETMEEAILPQAYQHDHEMVLDDLDSALSRLVLLGAAVSGIDSVGEFLAALPAKTRLTFLLTQHLGDHSEARLVEDFAAKCALPVRLASHGGKAALGEVLVVPAGQQVKLRRDGRIDLQANGSDAVRDPSIDISLTMAAGAFGKDALAIVFAGRGNDAVAGAQAIHDRGGQVWVESSSGEHFADMVSGIFAERLVSFSGTPTELAAHLIEVFP